MGIELEDQRTANLKEDGEVKFAITILFAVNWIKFIHRVVREREEVRIE
jgi:hypothetical protein